MNKYLAIYVAPVEGIDQMMKTMTPEQGKADMESWTRWMDSKGDAFLDKGAPLGKTKRATPGKVDDARNGICGYSIVQAESHEAAADIFKDSPHFGLAGSYVEVLAIMPMSA